ncbi:hypothetical protein ACWD9X_23420 [Streptomyces sp. NPDC005075]
MVDKGEILGGQVFSFEENEHNHELDGVEMLLPVKDPSKTINGPRTR